MSSLALSNGLFARTALIRVSGLGKDAQKGRQRRNFSKKSYTICVGRVAQSLQRLATGWTVRGSNSGEDEIFRTCPDRPWGPPSLLYNGYRVFPEGKQRPRRDTDNSPPSSSVVMKEQSYTSTPPMGRTACTEPQCLYRGGALPFTLHNLYSLLNIIKVVKSRRLKKAEHTIRRG